MLVLVSSLECRVLYPAGIPLTVHSSGGRSTSRASSQRTFVSSYSRRPSSAQGSRGVLVSASRAGAARAAAILLISCHVTATNDNSRMAGAQSPEDCEASPRPGTDTGGHLGDRLCAVLRVVGCSAWLQCCLISI